jgi:hypothetical protein
MTAKNDRAESKTGSEKAPIKRLVLRREKVRELKVQTGVRTGDFSGDSKYTGQNSNPQPSVSQSSSGGSSRSSDSLSLVMTGHQA